MAVCSGGCACVLSPRVFLLAARPQGECIPFPHELHESFTAELIHVFGPEIVVFMKVGSGQQAKAVLTANTGVRGVALCNTAKHKTWVMNNLVEYVKRCRLVSVADAPVKPAALIDWEKRSVANSKAAGTVPLPPPPGGAAVGGDGADAKIAAAIKAGVASVVGTGTTPTPIGKAPPPTAKAAPAVVSFGSAVM